MKKLFLFFSTLALSMSGQLALVPEKPFIEVTGLSEMEVVPDIIEVHITLQEYLEGKNKMSISKQEEKMKKKLSELGVDLKELSLITAVADYQRVRVLKKDVVNTKTYLLKLSSAEMVSRVYLALDELDVHNARITRLDHTKILDFQKENRIKAVKNAKEKAGYILQAIGKSAGDPLQVNEGENWVEHQQPGGRMDFREASNSMMLTKYGADKGADEDLSIRKIKIRSGFNVKFEIR